MAIYITSNTASTAACTHQLTFQVSVDLRQLGSQQPPQLPTLLPDGADGLSHTTQGAAGAPKQALQQVGDLQQTKSVQAKQQGKLELVRSVQSAGAQPQALEQVRHLQQGQVAAARRGNSAAAQTCTMQHVHCSRSTWQLNGMYSMPSTSLMLPNNAACHSN